MFDDEKKLAWFIKACFFTSGPIINQLANWSELKLDWHVSMITALANKNNFCNQTSPVSLEYFKEWFVFRSDEVFFCVYWKFVNTFLFEKEIAIL